MSWSMAAAGNPPLVKQAFAEQATRQAEQSHNSEAARAVIRSHSDVVAAHCDALEATKTMVVESSGHIDLHSSSSNLTIRTLYTGL